LSAGATNSVNSELTTPRNDNVSHRNAPSFLSRPSQHPVPHKKSPKLVISMPPPPPSRIIKIQSEHPFVIKIMTRGLPIDKGIRPKSARVVPKRKRPKYEELGESDPDDFLTDSGDDDVVEADSRVRLKKLKVVAPFEANAVISTSSGIPATTPSEPATNVDIIGDGVEAPPPGVLANLWYSREPVLHIWVIEKIIAWRTRQITTLEWKEPNTLDLTLANQISTKGLIDPDVWKNQAQRMEFSRVNPAQCPMVIHLAAKRELEKAGENAKFSIAMSDQREEVLLVKWRGRSYMHCSWERKRDLEKFDQSNNTAKNKIRRFLQAQEVTFGIDWKGFLEGGRSTPTPEGGLPEEDIFPSQNTEVERILACDESEMNLSIFAKQRALNMREEAKMLRKRDAEGTDMGLKPKSLFDNLPLISEGEDAWDPEDYVRYVVKWKSLQYSEMTWEYWKDIKREAVNEAEDFWFRQKAPSMDELREIQNRTHPHIREFRKLTESPAFAISTRERGVADLHDGFQEPKDELDEKPGSGFLLRSYQLEGVNWLLFNWWNKRSCILADEMGLGKTIQSVGFLHQLHHLDATKVRGPFLVVAPLSLIGQWQSESQTWAPDLNIVFYHGSADARDFLVQQEFYYTDQFIPKQNATKLKKQHVTKFHILITTYEVVLKDIAVLSKIKWKALIVDEAHRLKNPKARLFEELATVPRDFCVLLTGTPLQNSTEELWALLHFSDPLAFKSKEDFIEKFGQLENAKQVSDLHSVLKPYLLRRVKEDVEKSLPPKEETIFEVFLTPIQKKYYKAIYEKNTSFLFKGAKASNAPSLMNVMMELRKCCNHPFLIRGAEERILAEAAGLLKENGDDIIHHEPTDYLKIFGDQLVKSSGKMVLLSKLLPKLFSGGHKVLIFSQMVKVLDLLEELIKIKKYRYERLDGSTSASSRSASVERFNKKSFDRFVMLLSTRAGGLGLNLTSADTVIIFDSDWNPQNDLQAMARAHRIGQTRAVRVYRLLTAKTYEMHMFHSASMKLGLDRAVLAHTRQQQGEGDETKPRDMSEKANQAKEIDELLKKGAYDVFKDEDDSEATKFMESDIDALMEQSSKKVTYGDTSGSSLSSGLGSFSKASFVADTGDGAQDVDLDDPDFWKKSIGLDAPVETSEEIENMIDDGVKRTRRQVITYDPFAAFTEAEQKKKDKVNAKIQEEKDERERERLARRQKKSVAKERKKHELDDSNDIQTPTPPPLTPLEPMLRVVGEVRPKKLKKTEKSRASRRAEFEDPILEKLRQAWEVPQRNRAASAVLRFGFGRFSKLRNDSNLTSLPLQDLEVFARAFIYQIALQAASLLMAYLKKGLTTKSGDDGCIEGQLRPVISTWLGNAFPGEVDWICDSVRSAIMLYVEIETNQRSLRIPQALADPDYMIELRKGPAFRGLRRLGILNRLNMIMEDSLHDILAALGVEELGRRGCLAKDVSCLDADLKMRYVTTEELLIAVGSRLKSRNHARNPSTWWDRSCDIALIVGAFVHGYGNYESMCSDTELVFGRLIERCMIAEQGCSDAIFKFDSATVAARQVFEDALESAKFKQQKEAQAAVAAAVALQKKASEEEKVTVETDNVYSIDGDQDHAHLITLSRLAQKMKSAIRIGVHSIEADDDAEASKTKKKPSMHTLPMPDARLLDERLLRLVFSLDSTGLGTINPEYEDDCVPVDETAEAMVHREVVSRSSTSLAIANDWIRGTGLSSNQCGASHRSLDDGSDFAVGMASAELAQVSYGPDAPKYLRALGVPMNLTRYAILALTLTDNDIIDAMISHERNENAVAKPETLTEGFNNTSDSMNGETIKIACDNIQEVKAVAMDDVDSKGGGESSKNRARGCIDPALVPQSILSTPFQQSARLRACLAVTALHFGYCALADNSSDCSLHPSVQEWLGNEKSGVQLFNFESFISAASALGDGLDTPTPAAIKDYIECVLLPHCVKLCVYGNGPTTRNTRWSKGRYETALGYSLYQEPTEELMTPVPDPSVPVRKHSIEAVANAAAILRRARLLRTAQYLVRSGKIVSEMGLGILRSAMMQKSMQGLPLWWNPSIHDVGLVLHAAHGGIFGIIRNRENELGFFSKAYIEEDLRTRFARQLPTNASASEIKQWVTVNASEFPTSNVLERRLGLICSEASAHLGDDDRRYDHLPMFDHGGWPRN